MKNIKKIKSVGVIGRGRWGKKVIRTLINIHLLNILLVKIPITKNVHQTLIGYLY